MPRPDVHIALTGLLDTPIITKVKACQEHPTSVAPRWRGIGVNIEEPTRMKAEQRHRLQHNALADRVGRVVEGVKSAPATQSLALWLGVIAVIIVIVAWQFFHSASLVENSFLWRMLNEATREPEDVIHVLDSLRDDHPGTTVGTSAGYQLARLKFRAGQANLGNAVSFDRKDAIKNLVEARNLYAQLVKDSSEMPLLMQESMLMQAMIEESLTGVADPEKPTEKLGSLAKAKEQYQALATKYPESAAGVAAAKRVGELEKNQAEIESFYTKFNELMAAAPPASSPIDTNPIPAFPDLKLPKLPEGLSNPDVKLPETPATAKPGETKAPGAGATPEKPADGKPTTNPVTPPAKPPTIPPLPTVPEPAGTKPGDKPPATKAPEPTSPKTGDAKTPPATTPEKKQ
jgi:hypothetical protein